MAAHTINPFDVLPAPRSIGARWWAALLRFLAAAPTRTLADEERRPPKPCIPRRYGFLEEAAMRRAVERL